MRAGDRDAGAGSVLATGAVAAVCALLLVLLPLLSATIGSRRAAGAADASALAAADAASGAITGYPCERARTTAEAWGARLDSCVRDGLEVQVGVSVAALQGRLAAVARAGPPPGGDPP